MKLIPLKDINDNAEYYKGTRFRLYKVMMNLVDGQNDYYEYMLAEIPGERDFMLLTCVKGYKSGSALALVKTSEDKSKFIVNGKAIKYSIGVKSTYLLDES